MTSGLWPRWRHRIRLAQPRSAHLLAAALCAGLALSLALPVRGYALAAAAGLLGLAALADPAFRVPLLAAALAAAGLWLGTVRLESIDRSDLVDRIGEIVRARVEVTGQARTSPFTVRVPVRVRRADSDIVDERAQLELRASERAPPQGAILDVYVEVRRPRSATDEDDFDEAGYLRRQGAHVVLEASGYRVVGRRGGVPGAADRLRDALARSIAPGLVGERKALVAGIVLGADEGLDPDLRDRFRASGLYHLLAVSGQNVAYIVAGVLLAAWLAGVPRWLAQIGALAATAGYVAAVGWQPSVVRAGVAGGLASLAWLASRPTDRWYFMLVGAIVLLAWSPYALLDPGFQLSFAAVAAIFLLVPRLQRRLVGYPVPRVLGTVVVVSAACGLVTAPIVWLHFGSVPVLSILANALAAPVVAPILGLGLGAAAADVALPSAAAALAWMNGWLVAYLAWCARAVGGLPYAQVESARVLLGLLAAGAAAAALVRASQPARRLLLVGLLASAAVAGAWTLWPRGPVLPPPEGLRVSFLDVGQGDAILLQVPEGAVLVDEGPPEARVTDRLRAFGVRHLAAAVLTHPQRDHVGGAADVIREVRVDTVLDPAQPVPSPYADEALAAASDRGVAVVVARTGQAYRLGRLRLRVLWPEDSGTATDDPNDHAIVLLATYGEIDTLLTADAESTVTSRLRLPPVEILKVAHHGSSDAGLPALLDRLDPRVAVISVGAGNEYGHPAPSTLSALAGTDGLRVYRTDRDGTVVLETDGKRLTMRKLR